jgi:hypothetical protein
MFIFPHRWHHNVDTLYLLRSRSADFYRYCEHTFYRPCWRGDQHDQLQRPTTYVTTNTLNRR